jgi:Bromodomain associated
MKRRSSNTAQHQHPKVCKDDMIYCHGTARRAVARAALHLGIECMTAESIDVLAACLLDYLERIGAMMANNAEAAGRSSAHCNIYDAINAIELCTSAAAATTKSTNSMNGTANLDATDAADIGHSSRMDSFNKINLSNGSSWKDLASFCFGPNWNTYPSSSIGVLHDFNHQMNGGSRNATGGKAGPSAMLLMNGTSPLISGGLANPAIVGQQTSETGWNAPYPDEIEQFPVVSNKGQVANPHPLPDPRLHRRDINILDSSANLTVADDQEAEKAHDYLNTIPDSVFQNKSGWGELVESNQSNASIGDKRSLEAMEGDDSKPPPTKKVKLVESSSTTHEQSHPLVEALLLPTFYPPIPKPQNDDNRNVVTDGTDSKKSLLPSKTTTTRPAPKVDEVSNNEWDHNNPTRLLVRSALVGRNLGSSSSINVSSVSSSFWGSSWSTTANRSIDLVVPAGRPATVTGVGTSTTDGSLPGATSATASTALTAPSIVPISRASGSRVSRILEGSMDPPIL